MACTSLGGVYQTNKCYYLYTATRICTTVTLGYPGELTAEEAEIATKATSSVGCYPGNSPVKYKKFTGLHSNKQPVTFNFSEISVEVRSDEDPYLAFAAINPEEKVGSSLFFWLSIICLTAAILMIFLLGCIYKVYIEEEAAA